MVRISSCCLSASTPQQQQRRQRNSLFDALECAVECRAAGISILRWSQEPRLLSPPPPFTDEKNRGRHGLKAWQSPWFRFKWKEQCSICVACNTREWCKAYSVTIRGEIGTLIFGRKAWEWPSCSFICFSRPFLKKYLITPCDGTDPNSALDGTAKKPKECVCVCVRERESECGCMREREREKYRACACVCVKRGGRGLEWE